MKEGVDKEPLLAPTYDISNKNAYYLAALQNLGIIQNNTEEITEFETSPCPPDTSNSIWAQFPGNTRFDLKPKIAIELQNLYTRGKGRKIGELLQRRHMVLLMKQ